jgi:hypothetical protein
MSAFDPKRTLHGTLMSVGRNHGDANEVAARYGEVFGTGDGGESWLEMPLPQGGHHTVRARLRLVGEPLIGNASRRGDRYAQVSIKVGQPQALNRRRHAHRGHHHRRQGHDFKKDDISKCCFR